MRIAAVTTWFPTGRAPGSGAGTARELAALAAHPDVESVEVVHLVAPRSRDGVGTADVDGLPVRRVTMHPWAPLGWLRAARAVREATRGADVVHSFGAPALPPLVLRRPAATWVHTETGAQTATGAPAPRAIAALARLLLLVPAAVTAPTLAQAAAVRRVRYPRRTAVVAAAAPVRDHVTGRPMRPHVPLRLVAVGPLITAFDPLLAVATVAELRDRGLRAHLTWVGTGPLRAQVARAARRLRVADLVTLVGAGSPEDVADAIDAADLLLLPAPAATTTPVVAQALAAGRPVVVGAGGGREEVVPRAVGELVRAQTPAAYADGVLAIERRTQHLTGEEVAAHLDQRQRPDRVAAAYVDEYRHALRTR